MNARPDYQAAHAQRSRPPHTEAGRNYQQAEHFLTLLDEGAEAFTFQTFDDNQDRKDVSLVRVLNGSLEEHWPELCRLNDQGAGVFVTVNATDLKGRSTGNITRIRAVWQEADRADCPALPCDPHIIVESSPGKHHRYILTDSATLDEFEAVQWRLVEDYGSDPNAKDRARVLRLPGFYHRKVSSRKGLSGRPHLVTIVHESGEQPFPWDGVKVLFPPVFNHHSSEPPNATPQPMTENRLEEVRSALQALDSDCDYTPWLNIGMALHSTGAGAQAFHLWDEWSAQGSSYRPGETAYKWGSFGRLRNGKPITMNTLFRLARQAGWKGYRKPVEELLTSVDQSSPERLEAARREHQRRENQRIGEGEHTVPEAEICTIDEAIARYVFISDGSRVADLFRPHFDLAFTDWAKTISASKMVINDKWQSISKLWLNAETRKTAVGRTFKAGGLLFLNDPEGKPALNSWRPFDRSIEAGGDLQIFLEHISFLFPDSNDRERFLDWLAHIEQAPGELPHTAWLHISRHFGLGRNWLASLLTRVWAGHVAANVDLIGMLDSSFNGRISRKVLAVVDEIREGGTGDRWRHAERLKSLITEEYRSVNPKYGRQTVEFNCCRWLMFSNHTSAIPIERGDRRIEVTIAEQAPRSADYYSKLYRALEDPRFTAGVARYLGQRDISKFNPGAHARETEAKRAVVKASQTEASGWCEELVRFWPCDVIPSHILQAVVTGEPSAKGGRPSAAYQRTLEEWGIVDGRVIKIDNRATRLSILRNSAKWREATAAEIRTEWNRGPTGEDLFNSREFLLKLMSGAA